ncbi:hypothetical protein FB451DRAFT_1195796 [Mycena latifolia]|nr:hypothetical protein FB451DRAFT_1195796 [Mycena latifolia]
MSDKWVGNLCVWLTWWVYSTSEFMGVPRGVGSVGNRESHPGHGFNALLVGVSAGKGLCRERPLWTSGRMAWSDVVHFWQGGSPIWIFLCPEVAWCRHSLSSDKVSEEAESTWLRTTPIKIILQRWVINSNDRQLQADAYQICGAPNTEALSRFKPNLRTMLRDHKSYDHSVTPVSNDKIIRAPLDEGMTLEDYENAG